MIRAVIFDCFGVLTSDGWLPFKNKHFGDNPSLYEQATTLNHQVDLGQIDYSEFIRQVATLAQVSQQEAKRDIENNVPDEALFAYVTELKSKHRLGLLSNAAADWLSKLFKPEQIGLFDAIALSYETGFIKPQRQAYEVVAQRLGVAVGECVLVDDQAGYCEGARAAGMPAIHYTGLLELKRDLTTLLT